jgi:hypothetical protein
LQTVSSPGYFSNHKNDNTTPLDKPIPNDRRRIILAITDKISRQLILSGHFVLFDIDVLVLGITGGVTRKLKISLS